MGINRDGLRDTVSKDLQMKIDATALAIRQLRAAITTVDKSASEAKAEVQKAVDSIIEQLVARKLELSNQIDGLCQGQVLSLQDSIEAAYLRLGNLQSTLSNLDTYVGNQLVNLRVPDASKAINLPQCPPLKLHVETNVVSEELRKWIAVSSAEPMKTKEVDSVQTKSPSIRMPVQKSENTAPVSNSPKKGKLRPLFPENFLGIVNMKQDSAPVIQKEPKDSQIEHWLSGMRIGGSTGSDDSYEFLSGMDPVSSSEDMKVSSSTNPHDRKMSECEDGSSIVCVGVDDMMEQEDDMSKWLKPKKKRLCSSLSDVTNQAYLHKSKPSSKYQSLDFPCLRSEPSSWVQKRKKSSFSNLPAKSQQMCLQFGQSEIIPPTYALPFPFWLKK